MNTFQMLLQKLEYILYIKIIMKLITKNHLKRTVNFLKEIKL